MNLIKFALVLGAVVCVQQTRAADIMETNTPPTKPKIILDAGTQEDAEQALAVCREWLTLWQDGKIEKASRLVMDPVRKPFAADMKKRKIELKSIDDIRIYKNRDRLLGRFHITVAPKQGMGIDMEFQNGKWWITAR